MARLCAWMGRCVCSPAEISYYLFPIAENLMNVLIRISRIALALVACSAMTAHADVVDDWFGANGVKPVAYSGGPVEAKFGHPAPPTSLLPPVWQKTFERMSKLSNGKLLVKQYGAGTLIGPKDGFKAVRGGVAEWATCYVQNEGRSLPLSRVFEQPFVAPANPMAGVRIMQELAPKYFAAEFQKQGVAWGSAISASPTDVMSKKPIRKWEDLAGQKIIAQGFPPELAKLMGATFVNIPYPEAYTALQQGLADAMIWVDAAFVPYKIYEVAKYHTTLGMTGLTINLCYSKDFYAKLPAELQEIFYATQEPLSMAATKVTMVDFNKTALATYKEKGVEMITLAPAEMARWRTLAVPVVEKWAADLEKDGQPARALLADIKRLSKKYAAMSPDDLMKLAIEQPVRGIK
jgi:TRAP-type C4-dicarboxylate transport system substrate-binding protein